MAANPYWRKRRFPSVDETRSAIKECEKELRFWEQMLPVVLAIEGRRPQDETDFTNPVSDET